MISIRTTPSGRSRRSLRDALAVLALGLALTGCAPRVRYDVDLKPAAAGRVSVTMTLAGVPRDSLVLRGYADNWILRLDSLRVDAPGSRGFRVDSLDLDGNNVVVPRLVVLGPLAGPVTVRYDLLPARREGDAHVGFTGRSFGDAGPGGGFVRGDALFLLPPRPASWRTRVHFETPAGWSVIVPWSGEADGLRPGLGRRWGPEDLLDASIGFGRFDVRTVTVGRTAYRLAFDTRVAGPERARVATALESVIRTLHDGLGRDIGERYDVVVCPETAAGDELQGQGWADGQGGTYAPLTPTRLHTFARRLAAAHLEDAPWRALPFEAGERWVIAGAAELLAWRAVARAGLADEGQVARDWAAEYASFRSGGEDLGTLETPNADPEADLEPMRTIEAPFALVCLERAVGAEAVARALRAAFAQPAPGPLRVPGVRPQGRSFWAALPAAAQSAARTFRDHYVSADSLLPAETFFGFAPADTAPSPSRGPAAARITLAFTGNTRGYLENCGCRVGQSGGVARRATVLARLRREGAPVMVVDAGGAFADPTRRMPQDALGDAERGLYFDLMRAQGYAAAGFGETELALPFDSLRRVVAASGVPWALANVRGPDTTAVAPWMRLARVASLRVAWIGAFDPPRGRLANPRYQRQAGALAMVDPIEVVAAAMPLARAKADLVGVVGRLSPATIRALIARCPDLDLVVSSEDQCVVRDDLDREAEFTTGDTPGFVGRTLVLYATFSSYGMGYARLALDRDRRIAAARIGATILGDSIPDDVATRARLTAFYQKMGATDAAQHSVAPLFATDAARMTGDYAGAAACAGCHAPETAQWKTTPHFEAYRTLLDVHRHYQPRCVVCHVVGFGTPKGFRVGDTSPRLVGVQCEVCHGPGGEHVAAPTRANIRREVPEAVCLQCHNPERSDRFDYADQLPRVMHQRATAR